MQLQKGDKIFFYTGGLTEFIHKIYDDLVKYKGSEKFEDDVCIVGIEIS